MKMEGVTYERMDGVDAGHGQKFEWEMTTLAYLRCQKLHDQWKKDNRNGIKSFSVANNVKGAGNFDDIVIRVEYVVDSQIRNKVIFVQCKHIENPSKNSKKRFQEYLTKIKSLRDLFDSFVKIEQSKDQVMKELSSDEPIDTEQNIRLQQDGDRNNLRSFFLFKDIDTEFVFCSNIVIEPDFETSLYKSGTQNRKKEDIVDILFNTANTARFELHLKESDSEQLIFGNVNEQNSCKRKDFYEKFRAFVNQTEPETLILQELQSITNTHLDTEYLQTLTIEEIQNHFTSESPCTAITEKSNTIENVRNFMMIRKKSAEVMEEFCKNFQTQNVFSDETISQLQKQLENKEKSLIETNFQKLDIIKLKQAINSCPIESTSIFLQNENDSEEWMSARETISYSNLKNVYICFLSNVKYEIFTSKSNEVVILISECSEQKMTIAEYLNQFSIETQNLIMNAKLLFQGVQLEIKSLCGERWKAILDEDTICDTLQNKVIQVLKPLPDLGFYIDRHFQSECLNFEQIKMKMRRQGWTSVDIGILLFSENDKIIPGHNANYKIFDKMQDVRNFVQEFLRKPQDTYHLCCYQHSELKLIYSFGESSVLTVKNITTQEYQLIDKCTKINIITDVAGMGKTTTLLALAKLNKIRNPTHWVVFMELNKYLKELKRVKELSSTHTAINFVGSTILELKDFELRLFADACNDSGKVALYFDAFDEISPDAEKTLLMLLLSLERTKVSRILVSSRPNYATVLEKTLLQKSNHFLGLTTIEKEHALEGYWRQMLLNESKIFDECVLKENVQKIVQILQKESNLLNEILAIPLQIRMFATIYYESLVELNDGQVSELSAVNPSDLYEQFIRLHARRFYVDKLKMQWSDIKDELKDRFIEDKLRGAEQIACQIVIPELLEHNKTNIRNEVASLCDDLGLITNKNPPVFLHRTIAEYLAAKYVLIEMREFEQEETLCLILTKKRFNIIRKFINSLLIGKPADSFCKKENYRWWRNKRGDTPLHVASLEGNVEIMKFLLRCDLSLLNENNKSNQTPISYACRRGKIDALKLLLTFSDCLLNISDKRAYTVLHDAAIGGSTEIIDILHRLDTSLLNKQCEFGKTPLQIACINKNIEAAKFLLQYSDCSVNISDDYGNSVLHDASEVDLTEVMDIILQRDPTLVNSRNKISKTPLHYACFFGNTEAAKLLLSFSECSVNISDRLGYNVFHSATRECLTEIMKIILGRDNSLLNKQNKLQQTPLHLAFKYGDEAAKLILQNPDCLVNICDHKGNTVLHNAAASGFPEIIEMILQRDKSLLNKQNKKGIAPLHVAVQHGSTQVLKQFLLHSDCLVNICDKDDNTVLHSDFSPSDDTLEKMKMILQHEKAPVNKQNTAGETPLHRKIRSGNTDEAKLLLAQTECSVNICDNVNQTVLHDAIFKNKTELVEIILQRENVSVNQKTVEGKTPLHFAASRDTTEAVKLLITYPGCSINMRDNNGSTALVVASENKRQEIIEILLQHGAEYGNRITKENNTPSEQKVTADGAST